ncbi:MAG: hypothetical protein KatS3mg008_0235 [Acidimicrobiales bacterium]|nr:MAG: hypothetical protein KatS3mg008_0235 [Acidimicrobiales bacterium]
MKKGRHRRFEEARALKRSFAVDLEELEEQDQEPCPECGGIPGLNQAEWCMAPRCVEANQAERYGGAF